MKLLSPAIVLFALVFAACGGGGDSEATAQKGQAETPENARSVSVKGFTFKPSPLEVPAGTAVSWTNQDQITHTVTAGTPGSKAGTFDQALPGAGSVFTFTFSQPGTYPYFCDRHNSMTGTVIVT